MPGDPVQQCVAGCVPSSACRHRSSPRVCRALRAAMCVVTYSSTSGNADCRTEPLSTVVAASHRWGQARQAPLNTGITILRGAALPTWTSSGRQKRPSPEMKKPPMYTVSESGQALNVTSAAGVYPSFWP